MYVDDRDNRPPSLLRKRGVNVLAVIAGILAMIGFHAGVALVIAFMTLLFGSEVLAREVQPQPPEEPPEMQFVQAKLVKLGRQFDARELPNRMVEARTTAPRRAEVPTRDSQRVRIQDAGVQAMDSVEDVLARLGTRADEMARLARSAEQEGDPRGVEEGTHTAEEGDVYVSQLYAFFRRGFQMPPSIPDSERRGLRAVVRVQIAADGRVAGYELSSSRNADFDQAVRLRLDQAMGSRVPEPPEARKPQIYGNTIPISFVPPR